MKWLKKSKNVNKLQIEELYENGLNENNLEQIFSLFENKKYDEVLTTIEKILKYPKNSLSEFRTKGIIVFEMEKNQKIIPILDKMFALNFDNTRVLLIKGIILERISQYNEASICYDQVLKSNSKSIPALLGKGMICLNSEKFKDAISYFDKILDIQSDDETLFAKGLALEMIGRNEDSVKFYLEALKIENPNMLEDLGFHLAAYCGEEHAKYLINLNLDTIPKEFIGGANRYIKISNESFHKDTDLLNFEFEYAEIIEKMYQKYLERLPEKEGMLYWRNFLKNGKSFEWFEEQVINSPEAKKIKNNE